MAIDWLVERSREEREQSRQATGAAESNLIYTSQLHLYDALGRNETTTIARAMQFFAPHSAVYYWAGSGTNEWTCWPAPSRSRLKRHYYTSAEIERRSRHGRARQIALIGSGHASASRRCAVDAPPTPGSHHGLTDRECALRVDLTARPRDHRDGTRHSRAADTAGGHVGSPPLTRPA